MRTTVKEDSLSASPQQLSVEDVETRARYRMNQLGSLGDFLLQLLRENLLIEPCTTGSLFRSSPSSVTIFIIHTHPHLKQTEL
ncbi:hypothetical protein LINPERPRIM_LOCUS12197, partial [Linum perenne]